MNIITGTGLLGRTIGLDQIPGIRLGGLWIVDADYLITGGIKPRTWSFNSALMVD
jgi:porin